MNTTIAVTKEVYLSRRTFVAGGLGGIVALSTTMAPAESQNNALKIEPTRVINYSQWKSAKEVAAFRQDPYFGPYIQRLKALSSAESIECEVVYDKHV